MRHARAECSRLNAESSSLRKVIIELEDNTSLMGTNYYLKSNVCAHCGRGIHQCRHYFATEMYSATRDIRATQVALAHSSVSMTERYAHVVDLKEKINLVKPTL